MKTSTGRELPYGETVDEFQGRVIQHAENAEQRFAELIQRVMRPSDAGVEREPLTDGERAEHLLAHHATLYGWATASLLGFIAAEYGDDAAYRAAAMVQDMAVNGGAPYAEDIADSPEDSP